MTPAAVVPGRRRVLVVVAVAQLLVLTLWFSTAAVAEELARRFGLDTAGIAALTLAVQVGFVVGAVGSSVTGLADAVAARRLFLWSSLAGALTNLAVLLAPGAGELLLLRFLTGVALAGVYPAGLKVLAGWFRRGRGMALGVLVGALTVGSAAPHLVRGLGLDATGVIAASSLLATVGGVLLRRAVADGPYEVPPSRFSPAQVRMAVADRAVRLATYGYVGHMWELYAMWTWTAAFLAASAAARGEATGWVPVATFAVIASGGIGSWVAGLIADRRGRTVTAGGAMAVSGTLALLSPVVFAAAPVVTVGWFLLWGVTVVADSAQFSAMVTETAAPAARGTALTLQTGLGFLITLVTIRGVPVVVEAAGWRFAFPILALGPLLGTWAMVRLRRSPAAARLAGGGG